MSSRKVIVFGPTGAVGSATVRTAHALGAKVVLAMRDITKSIPGLSAEEETKGNFERIHADLTKAETVRDAITKSGAKYAFMYVAHGTPDSMKSTIEALKVAGIEFVVFLSSFTVRGDLKAIQPSEVIPYIHAQVEINLEAVFGADGFVALRPGSFVTNILQYKAGIKKGMVKVFGPDATIDLIVQEDIGAVAGTVLAKGPEDEERKIYVYGPQLLPQREVVKILAKALGKSVTIETSSEEEAYKTFVEERRMPGPIAKYMVRQTNELGDGGICVFGYSVSKENLSNVQKYAGKKATTFEEWVGKNLSLLES